MSKTLKTIPAGNLLRVAETKSIKSLSALEEKTGVDRKTLRAINAGKQVKETTLQSVADKLRVPLAHLVGASPADEHEVSISGEYHYREITLQRLDATSLRRIAESGCITWLLKIDHMSEELETLLMSLEKSLDGWCRRRAIMEFAPEEKIKLSEQISAVKTSADIDKIAEEFAQRKLNIYGGTYVYWTKELPRDPDDDYYPIDPPTLNYISRHTAALCITPEGKNVSTVQVATGYEPPQEFVESKLEGINFVKVDRRQVWSRKGADIDEIPF